MLSRKETGPSEEAKEAAQAAGKEETRRLNADIPESLHRKIRMEAAAQDVSIKEVVIEMAEQYLDR